MRHKVYGKHLGRDKNQRSALFKNLVRSLILHESIQTTEPKAKAIKPLVDKIITNALSPSAKRLVSQFLSQPKTEEKLISDILPRLGQRTSGFTTMVRIGRRLGDGAMLVNLSLLLEEKDKKPKLSKELKKETTEVKDEQVIIEGETV